MKGLRGLKLVGAIVGVLLLLPVSLAAQGATITGAVADSTGGVLPGATVTALLVSTGTTYLAVTDGAGNYRLALRAGIYNITAALPGFTTVVQEGFELGTGADLALNYELAVSSVEETITVTGESPLVELVSSEVGGRIDSRQLEEMPISGRNFVDLTMLAVGSRANAVNDQATERSNESGESQINIDGQQVSQLVCCQDYFGNPRYSKDAIAEFEVITSRFDATQGHSMGIQVNAITKSGTNQFSGSFAGYFRHDKFNQADFVAKRVLPYEDQQISGTFGGPLVTDRMHFFTNYEWERQPSTKIFTTGYPTFDATDLLSLELLNMSGLKLDFQINPSIHAMARYTRMTRYIPVAGHRAGNTISAAQTSDKSSDSAWGTLTQVFGAGAVNEIKGGYHSYYSYTAAYVDEPIFRENFRYRGSPYIPMQGGLRIGGPSNLPQYWIESRTTVRDDLTMLFSANGRHEVKIGGEFMRNNMHLVWLQGQKGILYANTGPVPTNIESVIGDQYDWRVWDLDALSSISSRWAQAFGDPLIRGPAHIYSLWFQDNWSASPQVTLNLGVRWEYAPGMLAEDYVFPPFMFGRATKKSNFQPRLGFNYSMNDGRTSIRGGGGKYIAMMHSRPHWGNRISQQTCVPTTVNDGRADFASNPYNDKPLQSLYTIGSGMTLEQACSGSRDTIGGVVSPHVQLPYSWQGSFGMQQQISSTMGFEMDWVYQAGHEWRNQNGNLQYDENGINYPFSDTTKRYFPNWGVVRMTYDDQFSDFNGLQMGLAKRFSNDWQANFTYLLGHLTDGALCPPLGLTQQNVETCPADLGGEQTLAVTDQRHRITASGIWSGPGGFQLSGMWFFGSGMRYDTRYGGDYRQCGSYGCQQRLRPDGTIVPRNNFVGSPVHRMDIRLMQRFDLGGVQVDGLFEIFNLYNHENYGAYNTRESSIVYGTPRQDGNNNPAYQPRSLQLGFRVLF